MTTPASRVTDARITCEDSEVGNLYYVEIAGRAPPPYTVQRHVGAILDIAADGTLAGIELIDDMPPLRSLSDSVSDGNKGVRVKPLDWQPIGPADSDVEAETPIGTYTMSFDALSAGGGVNLWMAGADVDTFTVHDKQKNAEAAAQADYEQRIWSALDSGTGGQQPVAWVAESNALEVATVEHDAFSMVEIVKSRNCRAARILTIHRTSEETGRRDDISIDLTEDQAAAVASALYSSPTEPKAGVVSEEMVERAADHILGGSTFDREDRLAMARKMLTAALNGDKS